MTVAAGQYDGLIMCMPMTVVPSRLHYCSNMCMQHVYSCSMCMTVATCVCNICKQHVYGCCNMHTCITDATCVCNKCMTVATCIGIPASLVQHAEALSLTHHLLCFTHHLDDKPHSLLSSYTISFEIHGSCAIDVWHCSIDAHSFIPPHTSIDPHTSINPHILTCVSTLWYRLPLYGVAHTFSSLVILCLNSH